MRENNSVLDEPSFEEASPNPVGPISYFFTDSSTG
jgi:hypothetical protein